MLPIPATGEQISYHRFFNRRCCAVFQDRLAPADLLQCQLAAFVVQLLEPIEAVPAVPHHLAGLADIAELFGQLQQTHLHPDNLLLLRHVVVSVSPEGRARSRLAVENRARPPALRRKPTTNVRLSPSSYTYCTINRCS